MVDFILGLLFLITVAGIVLGLIKPALVLHWGKKRTRLRAVGWYGLFALLTFVAIGIIAPAPQHNQAPAKPEPAVSAVAEPAKQPAVQAAPPAPVAEAPAKQPEPVASPAASAPVDDAAKLAEEQTSKEKVRQAEEAKKQAEAEAARGAAAKVARARAEIEQAQQAQARAMEAAKAKIRAFEKDLHGYDAVSALYMENAKAMTRRLGKDASQGDLYQALKQARQYAQAGANEVLKLRVPDVPKPVEAALKEAKEASWQMLLGRKDALDAFMDWLDSRKPSDQVKMQEESDFSTLQAAKCVASLLKAKTAAGFTKEEIKADLKAEGGDTLQQATKAKATRRK